MLLVEVSGHVVKLGPRTVGIDQQLPFTFPNGYMRADSICLALTELPKERSGAFTFRLTCYDVAHVETIQGIVRRNLCSGYLAER